MTKVSPSPATLRLARCGLDDPGRALGLRSGDVLIGVAGQAWQGSPEALRARFAGGDPLLVSFLRGDVMISLLVDRADLGRWERTTPPDRMPALPAPDDRLCNWQIMQHHDGHHDLFALRPQTLALLAPALWLAQERMFTWLVALGAALALALPGGALLMGVVWIAAGLHLWRQGPLHIRQARLTDGYRPAGVIAARSAAQARADWDALVPGARFRFDSPRATAKPVAEQPAL
jgi:hypothetical protein